MGYDVFAGWGIETVWGTVVARTEFARPYDDTRLQHEKPQQPNTASGLRDAEFPFFQVERGMGTLVIPAVYAGMERLIEHCMGASLVTTGVDPYTHTFDLHDKPYTRATTPLVGLSIEHHLDLPDTNLESMIMHGGRCKSFGMAIQANEEVKWTSEWVGEQVEQLQKTASPTFPDYQAASSPLVNFNHVAVTLDAGGSQEISSFEFTVNNNLRDDRADLDGTAFIANPLARAKREITGTMEKNWINKTAYDKFVAGTAASILATATGPGDFSMTVRLENVRYTGETPGATEGEEYDQTLPFVAYHDSTYGALQIVQINNTSAP